MLSNNNDFGIGINSNPILKNLFNQNYAGISSAPPPVEILWVEDLSGEQMVTEDLSENYVFIGA